MNVLIVGGGALGRVFGAHLAAGGASVSVLVKPGQRRAAERGYALSRLRRFRAAAPATFAPSQVFVDPSELVGAWDAIWLCVASPALTGSWVEVLRARVVDATLVTIGQGLHDRAALERYWSPDRVVEVVPSVFAFEAEDGASTAFWVPLGAPLQVSGERSRVQRVVESLRHGGLAAMNVGVRGQGTMMAALNIPYFAGLEVAGWSFALLERQLEPVAAAAREAAVAVAREHSTSPPPGLATSPRVVRTGLRALRWLAPFDFESYARRHFMKVSQQTREMLDTWIEAARKAGTPFEQLQQLRAALPPLPASRDAEVVETRAQADGTNAP